MTFADHFSDSPGYAQFRPEYPPALFDWLADVAPRRELALDVGTGTGQAAIGLSRRFRRVIAIDPSAAQIARAVATPGVEYRVATAEDVEVEERVDLVCIAQALHWLDLDRFWPRVGAAAAERGVVAAFTYGRCLTGPSVDALVDALYSGPLRGFWPPERTHVEDGYARLSFPFDPLPVPAFALVAHWSVEQFLGYLRTWSACRRRRDATGRCPVDEIEAELRAAFGGPREVSWPLRVRAGRIS
jgi:SAM-dependent methyltransferase